MELLGLASETTGTGTPVYFTRTPDGQLIGMRQGAGSGSTNDYYSMTDTQNSVLGVTDSTGAVAHEYAYDPYGQSLATYNAPGAPANNLLWLGAEYDRTSGMYYLGDRYYSPALARLFSPGPETQPLDLTQQSVYQYAGGDPINNNDISGAGFLGDVIGLGIAAVGAGLAVAAFSVSSATLLVAGAATSGAGLGVAVDVVLCDKHHGIFCKVF